MRNVCDDCKWQKKRLGGEWNCVKYGIPMRYGRTYCVAYDRENRKEGNYEKAVSDCSGNIVYFFDDKHVKNGFG